MTYLQSKPIVSPAHPNKPQSESEDPLIQMNILDTNHMLEVIRRLQRGARAVHITFNSLNKYVLSVNT